VRIFRVFSENCSGFLLTDERAVSGKNSGGFILRFEEKQNKEINHAGQPICSGFRKVSGTKRREMVLRWIADGRRAVRMNSDGRNRAMGDLGPVHRNRLCAHVVRDGRAAAWALVDEEEVASVERLSALLPISVWYRFYLTLDVFWYLLSP
jgi:hypothetical protein